MGAELFDYAAECLEQHTSFNRLEARGTLRIALKSAGLDPKELTVEHLRVVFLRVMPGELARRGVDDPASICGAVVGDLAEAPAAADVTSPRDVDGIFRRLGGD